MKKYFLSLAFFLLLVMNNSLYSQYTSWENISYQIPGDSLNNLSDVFVLDRWVGFISSSLKPEIYRSEFSTGTWQVLQTPSPVIAFYILYYDQGFMCGSDSTVYQTTDAGESWNYFASLGENINDIGFGYDIYNLNGYICANNGVIGSIEDTSLIIINSGLTTDFTKLSSPQKDKVWLVGNSSIYFYNGSTFTKQFTSDVKLKSVHFGSQLYGWVVGEFGFIAQTSNGGNNWIQIQNPDTLRRNLNDIYLAGPYGWAVGDSGVILRTSNGGNTWAIDTDWLTSNILNAIHCTGYSVEFGPALAVGENKTALIYFIVVSVDDEPKVVDNFYLYQNYPNPFNPTTKIKFSIPSVETHRDASLLVSLKIYDILGNEIATLVNEEKPAGNYEVEFNVTQSATGGSRVEIASGIYFYQLKAGGFIETKKMILLR